LHGSNNYSLEREPRLSVLPETAASISNTLVRVMKIVGSMKSHMPLSQFVPVQGVDHSHFPILFTLAHEPNRVSALAELIHSDVSTLSRQVSHLVHIGLVEKIGDPDVIDEIVKRRGEWFEVLLKGWSEEDAATFLALLERFGDDVELYKVDLTTSSHTPELAHTSAGHTPSHMHSHTNQEH
jgi:hypothetical protein